MTDALVYECDLDDPPEKVWRAIATPEVREAWLGEPEDGDARVAEADPPSRLDLVWPTQDGETLVSFEIADGEGGGTHLTIVHRALAPAVVALRPRRVATAPAGGWRMAA